MTNKIDLPHKTMFEACNPVQGSDARLFARVL